MDHNFVDPGLIALAYVDAVMSADETRMNEVASITDMAELQTGLTLLSGLVIGRIAGEQGVPFSEVVEDLRELLVVAQNAHDQNSSNE